MSRMTRTAIASLSLLTAASLAHGAGGLELDDKAVQALPLISQPDLFAGALRQAWAPLAPAFCDAFKTALANGYYGRVNNCDSVPTVLTTTFLQILPSSPMELYTSLPPIVVHTNWPSAQNQNLRCQADLTLVTNIAFPLAIVAGGSGLYRADGVIQQIGFDPPVANLNFNVNQIVWHAPCDSAPPLSPSTMSQIMRAATQTALSNLGFPGSLVNDTFKPYAGTIQNALSLHTYTVALTNGDLVFTVQGSRLSDKALPLPATAATAKSAWGPSGQTAGGGAASGATAPNWSTPAAGASTRAASTGSMRTSRPLTPGSAAQTPLAPGALGSH